MFEGPGNPELVEELQEKLASFGSQVVLVDRDLGVRAKQVVREAWSGGEAATA
jgi:septum formation inhibitor-activating ATPase MinD